MCGLGRDDAAAGPHPSPVPAPGRVPGGFQRLGLHPAQPVQTVADLGAQGLDLGLGGRGRVGGLHPAEPVFGAQYAVGQPRRGLGGADLARRAQRRRPLLQRLRRIERGEVRLHQIPLPLVGRGRGGGKILAIPPHPDGCAALPSDVESSTGAFFDPQPSRGGEDTSHRHPLIHRDDSLKHIPDGERRTLLLFGLEDNDV